MERTLDQPWESGTAVEPLGTLRAVVATRRRLDEVEARYVEKAVLAGRSWSEIANALGVSKQAAHKRHAKRIRVGATPVAERSSSVWLRSRAS